MARKSKVWAAFFGAPLFHVRRLEVARLEEILEPQHFGAEDTLEARASIQILSAYLNRTDFTEDSVPATIQLAAKTLATSLQGARERAAAGVVTREQSDDIVVAYDTSATRTDANGLTPEVRSMIAPYRLSPGI